MSVATDHDHDHDWRHIPAQQTPQGRVYGPYRICQTCGDGNVLTVQPPADHPDATALPMSAEHEAVFAALAELFPEEAI